jgi:hypothetical protein
MAVQVTIAAQQVDKERIGYIAISLDSMATTAAVTIKSGSKVEISGALYDFNADEVESGGTWAALTASALAWIYIVPAGATTTFIYSNTAPAWDVAKQGWYNGANRAVAVLYKDAASLYQCKNLIVQGEAPITFVGSISSTVDPWLFNLPASSGSGLRIRLTDLAVLTTGLIKIAPAGADKIGAAGNVACYLNNVDQSGFIFRYQFLDLVDDAAGYWKVIGGQFIPEPGSVETGVHAGDQYYLGKLHHLPLGNVTDRTLYAGVPPAGGAWTAAITATGIKGIPVGAKAIRVKVYLTPYATAAGRARLDLCFSDNNGSAPTTATAHPGANTEFYASALGEGLVTCSEIDIPLNSAGQFYCYSLYITNVTLANCALLFTALGWYDGE